MTKTTMKNASSKKILSIILSLVMLLSALPLTAISAFAVSNQPYVPESPCVDGELLGEIRTDIETHISQDGLWSYWVLSDGKSIELCYDFENFEYDAYLGDEANLIIPETIDGYTVTQIGEFAFASDEDVDFSFLESVVIPDTVKYIGLYAFDDCENLESVTIGNGVEIIQQEAFAGCTSLTDIYIPDSVTLIHPLAIPTTATVHAPYGSYAETWALAIGCNFIEYYDSIEVMKCFEYEELPDGTLAIKKYIGSFRKVIIPESYNGKLITSIGRYAFYDCEALASVTIPDSVTSIGYNAFCDCLALADVYIPDSVTEIDEYAFNGFRNLVIHAENAAIFEGTFVAKRGDVTEDYRNPKKDFTYEELPNGTLAITGYTGENSEIEIPERFKGILVTAIAEDAFAGNDTIESVTVPNSITTIEDGAFAGCTSLSDVTLPDSVTEIGDNVFDDISIISAPEGSYADTWVQEHTKPEEILGDINGDGEVTLDDYAVLKNYLSGVTVYGLDYSAFDVNGDGAVDGFDLFYINRYINCGTPYDAM